MSEQTILTWKNDMVFSAHQDGHEFLLDAAPAVGGQDRGPRPKTLMLTALAGCTGMDVISILRKMRIQPEGFELRVAAELTEEHPKVFKSIQLIYTFKGKDLPLDKLQKAVNLSQDKYCGVTAMLAKICPLEIEIVRED